MSIFQISDINFWEKIDSLENALNRKKHEKTGLHNFSEKTGIYAANYTLFV